MLSLNISSVETIGMIQKASAMGNRWLAASSWQHTCSCIMPYTEFFSEISNYPHDSAPLQPRFGALQLLAFPKTKITFEREEIIRLDKMQENTTGQVMAIGRMWKVPNAYFEKDRGIIVLCTMFLVSSSINVSIFHITWLDNFWTDLVYLNFCIKIEGFF